MPVHIGDRPRRKHGSAHGDRRAADTRHGTVGKTERTLARSPAPAPAQTASACLRLALSPYRYRCSPRTGGYSGSGWRHRPRRDRRRRRPYSSGHSQSTPRCSQQVHRTSRRRPSGASAASPPRESSYLLPTLSSARQSRALPTRQRRGEGLSDTVRASTCAWREACGSTLPRSSPAAITKVLAECSPLNEPNRGVQQTSFGKGLGRLGWSL